MSVNFAQSIIGADRTLILSAAGFKPPLAVSIAQARRRSSPDEIASAWISRVAKAVMTFSCMLTEPRWLTHSDSSYRAALMATWFRCSSSRVSATVEAWSSMRLLQIREFLGQI